MEKLCPRCEERKDYTLFYRNRASPDGRATYCIECAKKYQKEWQKGRQNKPYKRREIKQVDLQELLHRIR